MSSPKDDHTECGAEASERTNLEDDLADKDVTEAIQTQLGIDTAALTSVSVDPDPTKRTFTVFPNLPFELRTKIWGFTTPAKVIVHALQGFPYRYRIGPYKRPDGVPSILHACQESRFEFLHRDGVTKEHPTYAFLEVSSSEFPASGVFLAPDYDILVAETRGKLASLVSFRITTKCPQRSSSTQSFSLCQILDSTRTARVLGLKVYGMGWI